MRGMGGPPVNFMRKLRVPPRAQRRIVLASRLDLGYKRLVSGFPFA